MKVGAASREDFAWLEEHAGCALDEESSAVKAVDTRGRIRGMVGFESWTHNSVQAHMAVDTPIAWRALLPAALGYVFEEAGRGVLLGVIPAYRRDSLRFAQHVGFEVTHRVRDGWAKGVDLLLLELRREDCRWLSSQGKAA